MSERVGAGRLLEALSYHHDLRALVKNPQGGIVFQSPVLGTELTSDENVLANSRHPSK